MLRFLVYVKPKLNFGLFLRGGDFLEGEAVFRKREGEGSLRWQQRAGSGSGALPCQGFSVGSDMKGSSRTASCKPPVLGVFLWVRDRGMYGRMYSFVWFSHLNKQKYFSCNKERREE